MKLYLDHSVLSILGRPGPRRELWADWLRDRLTENVLLYSSVHALQLVAGEFGPEAAVGLRAFFGDLDRLLEAILPVHKDDILLALDLSAAHGLSREIALEAALALQHQIESLAAADSAYDRIPGLRRWAPDE